MDGLMGSSVNNLFRMSDMLSGFMTGLLFFILITSAVQAFFGYKVFKFIIGVEGFFIFALIGYALGGGSRGNNGLSVILAIILGCLGAFLAMRLYKIGVFIQCFGAGVIFGSVLGGLARLDGGQITAMAFIVGLLLGVIGVILVKPVIILSTGFFGGMVLGICLAILLKSNMNIGVFLGIAASIGGILYQFKTDKKAPAPVEPVIPTVQG